MSAPVDRRTALRNLVIGTAGASLTASPVRAQTAAPSPAAAPSAASQPEGVCVLLPQAVEGPYYFDPKMVRSDITEGRPGAPLTLVLRVIEHGLCAPISNARVDVWHADASGVYSGYAGQGDARDVTTKGQTYLRGTQMTDADGRVTFNSVYPGWYPGRTPHIHVKVFLDEQTVLTGQIYFPDEMSARIYRQRAPYNARPVADTANTTDFIFKAGEREGGGTVLAMAETPERLTASLLIAVDRTGEAAKRALGWGDRIRTWLGRE